jgi:GTPase SAR1 family protein
MNNEESTILNNDCKYKVVFLGDSSVGKTSLVEFIMYGSSNGNQQVYVTLLSPHSVLNPPRKW